MTHVTPAIWSARLLQHPRYGSEETYRLAAAWVCECAEVADWGGGTGFLRHLLPASVRYRCVDGTLRPPMKHAQVLADLATYREPSEAIVLRHVVDMTEDWQAVLANALAAFRRRLVVITFTPDAETTHLAKRKSGWPIWHFNPDDLRARMRPFLVCDEARQTSHPERVYLLERPCAS